MRGSISERRLVRVVSDVVRGVLSEASDGRFDVRELSSCRSYASRVRYCREHLGDPVGNGSSRMVFQIDDGTVLKLAKNEKGVAQNRVEGEYWKRNYDIFPKIYEQDEDNLWIRCEYVLPAKAADFKKCLGVSFKDVCAFMESEMSRWSRYGYRESMSYEECGRLVDEHPTGFFCDLESWMSNAQVTDRDVMYLRNWGLAMRDGQAMPVYLDHGLNQDVFDRYYKRW